MSFRRRVTPGQVLAGEKGLAGVIFIFISIWAFSSLGMLLGIYYTARNIESNVEFITRDVGEIKGETTLAALLVETNRLADEIKAKVTPLSPLLDEIIPVAQNIKKTIDEVMPAVLVSFDQGVGKIQKDASAISATVGSVNGTLQTVGKQALEIRDIARNIGNNVTDASNRAANIGKMVDRATVQAVTIGGLIEEIYNKHVHPAQILVGTPGVGADQKLPDKTLTIKGYAREIAKLANGNGCRFFAPTACPVSTSSPFSRGSLLR